MILCLHDYPTGPFTILEVQHPLQVPELVSKFPRRKTVKRSVGRLLAVKTCAFLCLEWYILQFHSTLITWSRLHFLCPLRKKPRRGIEMLLPGINPLREHRFFLIKYLFFSWFVMYLKEKKYSKVLHICYSSFMKELICNVLSDWHYDTSLFIREKGKKERKKRSSSSLFLPRRPELIERTTCQNISQL